jgi:hypothetical protein
VACPVGRRPATSTAIASSRLRLGWQPLFFTGNLQNFPRISHRALSIASALVINTRLFCGAGELAQIQQAKMMPHGNFE